MKSPASMYKCHRFPAEIIQYVVWLYYRFDLSARDIEDLMAERGISVSYESIRLWWIKFGPRYVRRLRRRYQGYGDALLIDEVFVKIQGRQHYLGEQLIRTAMLWVYCYSAAGTERQQNDSSSGCCERVVVNPDELSPTN